MSWEGGLQTCAAGARYATFFLSPCCMFPFRSAFDQLSRVLAKRARAPLESESDTSTSVITQDGDVPTAQTPHIPGGVWWGVAVNINIGDILAKVLAQDAVQR